MTTNLPTSEDLMEKELNIEVVAYEVARNQCGARITAPELLIKLGLTDKEFMDMSTDKIFKQKVIQYVKEFEDSGISFKLKAQILAEDLLGTQYKMLKDKDTPPSVVVAGVANIVRWAGLDKKASDGTALEGTGNKISVNISLGGDTPTNTPSPTITVENGEDE